MPELRGQRSLRIALVDFSEDSHPALEQPVASATLQVRVHADATLVSFDGVERDIDSAVKQAHWAALETASQSTNSAGQGPV